MWPADRYFEPPVIGGGRGGGGYRSGSGYDNGNGGNGGGGVDDINLPFIIALSSSLSFILLMVLVMAVYYIFFNDSFTGSEYGSNNLNIPDSFSNMEDNLEDESIYLDKLSELDQFYYKMSKKFQKMHKPNLTPMGHAIDLNIQLLMSNRGISCFYFEPYLDQLEELCGANADSITDNNSNNNNNNNNNSNDSISGSEDTLMQTETAPLINNGLSSTTYGSLVRQDIPYVIEDRTEICFLTETPSSSILNLPMPTKNRHNDTIYFETKLFEFTADTTRISIGLSTKPNPNFRLPGEYYYSFGLETTGHLKINRPMYEQEHTPVLTPALIQGDVIGIGFKSLTGTVFITHNGKKCADIIKNLKTDLYPCIGSVGGVSKVQVNLGQSGFVFIEANVKKLGFCENNNEGNLGAPPIYDKVVKKEKSKNSMATSSSSSDIVLERGEALPPSYPEEEDTFFGPKALQIPFKHNNNAVIVSDVQEEADGVLPSKPPSYKSSHLSTKSSQSSEKIAQILSSKLQKQQQIPDKLLNLNERYYEHTSSAFDKNENVNHHGGDFGIAAQDLMTEEEGLPSSVSISAAGITRVNSDEKKSDQSSCTSTTATNSGVTQEPHSQPSPELASASQDTNSPKRKKKKKQKKKKRSP